jgi:outer membrane lipoprotein-sorting protein
MIIIMKRIAILLLAVTAAGQQARADERSQRALNDMTAAVRALGDYEVVFSVEMEGTPVAGSYVVSGDKYALRIAGGEMFSDGEDKYTVNHADKTVDISKANDGMTVFSNPAKAFDLLSGEFSHALIGEAKRGGVPCNEVKLTARSGEATVIYIYISREGSRPVAIGYLPEEGDEAVWVNIRSIASVKQVDQTRFRFDKKRYADYEVVDFR